MLLLLIHVSKASQPPEAHKRPGTHAPTVMHLVLSYHAGLMVLGPVSSLQTSATQIRGSLHVRKAHQQG